MDDDNLEAEIYEEEESSKVTITRSTRPADHEGEIDIETSVVEDSALEDRSSWSPRAPIRTGEKRNVVNQMRKWSSSAKQQESFRNKKNVRSAKSRSDSHMKDYDQVKRWAVDYNNRNYIRSFCHKPVGQHRKIKGRTFDWDVNYSNNQYVKSLIHTPKGHHRRMKEVHRKIVPDNDIFADSRGWQFEYGHEFLQQEEDVPYSPEERLVTRGAYRCYGVARNKSDSELIEERYEREPAEGFHEEEFKYGREFLQDDMPLMILGKDDRRTLRGGYRFYGADRSKCDEFVDLNKCDSYDEEPDKVPAIPQERKFKRTILKKTLKYHQNLTDKRFGTALSFVPGEGSNESLEGVSTTLPSLRAKKKENIKNAFQRREETDTRRVEETSQRREDTHMRDQWKRNQTRGTEDPREKRPLREIEEEEFLNNREQRSYKTQEEIRRGSSQRDGGNDSTIFQPRPSFDYSQRRPSTKSFDRTPVRRTSRAFEEEAITDDEKIRLISAPTRKPNRRSQDFYQRDEGNEEIFASTAVWGRKNTEDAMERRRSSQKKPPRLADPYYERGEKDSGFDETFASTAVWGKKNTEDAVERRRSSQKKPIKLADPYYKSNTEDAMDRRRSSQMKPIRLSSPYYQREERDEEGDEETFASEAVWGRSEETDEVGNENTYASTAVWGRRNTDDAMERRRSSQKKPTRPIDDYRQSDNTEEEDHTYISTASWGNPRQSRQGSRSNKQIYSPMAFRKGVRSSESVGSKKYIVSESEESCSRTRSKKRLQTILSEEKRRRKRDKIFREKPKRNFVTEDSFDADEAWGRVRHDVRQGSMCEKGGFEVEHKGGRSEDQWESSRKTNFDKRRELEKRNVGSHYAKNQRNAYKENSQRDNLGREMHQKYFGRQRKEIQDNEGFQIDLRKHRNHPKDYGEYAEDGYEKFVDKNGNEVWEKAKKKYSKLFHHRS